MKRFFRLIRRDAFLRSLFVNFVAGCVTALVLVISVAANAQGTCSSAIGPDQVANADSAWFHVSHSVQNSPHFQTWRHHLKQSFFEVENPLSLSADLPKPEQGTKKALESLIRLSLTLAEAPGDTTFKKVSDWIQSGEQALFVYDLIAKTGVHQQQNFLEYLIKHNDYFKRATPMRGPPYTSLVTYAFEKETTNPNITLLYKDPKYSDDQWLDLSDEKRLSFLKRLQFPIRAFQPPSVVGFTGLKPHYLSGFSQEVDVNDSGWGAEITHKKFEFDRARAIKQVKEVSAIFKETDSFHFHLVFELVRDYPKFNSFKYWFKHMNDYFTLKGMEEGLHGNGLTDVVDLGHRDSSFLNSLADIQKSDSKYYSVGLRGHMYGQSPSEQTYRIGLELRDVTRNLDTLDKHTQYMSESIALRSWEKVSDQIESLEDTPALKKSIGQTLGRLQPFMADRESGKDKFHYAGLIASAAPSLNFAFIEYEKGRYFNFRTGQMESPSSEVAQRIKAARQHLKSELLLLMAELIKLDAKRESYTQLDIAMASKMILADWAKRARVSELYKNY